MFLYFVQMKVIIAPDKFKGSLNTFELCSIIREGVSGISRHIETITFPMADGGDGFAAVMKHYLGTTTIACNTVDPLGRPIAASYEWYEPGKTAIIEVAIASGLALLKKQELNPLLASTYGTGLMVKDAIDKGATGIILGLGGSATNDGGTGILAALGFRFLNDKMEEIPASGAGLELIRSIEPPAGMQAIKFEIACDVENTLYGGQGAAHIYAPQKGADAVQVQQLDNGLRNFAGVLAQHTDIDIANIPGAGAAGGIAAGLMPFFDVEMKKGIKMIVDAGQIRESMEQAVLLITGEGKIDGQSGTGKVVGYLASLAALYDIPCHAICGEVALDAEEQRKLGLAHVVSLVDESTGREDAIKNARQLILKKAKLLLNDLS